MKKNINMEESNENKNMANEKNTNTVNERNTNELPLIKEKARDRTADFTNMYYAYSEVGDQIKSQASALLKAMDASFGTSYLTPEIASIPKMVEHLMQGKRPEDYVPVLDDFQNHTPGSRADLLKAKYTYEKNSLKNTNDNKKICIQGGAALESAKADWTLALSSYDEDKQNCEIQLLESIYATRKSYRDHVSDGDLDAKIEYHVNFYSEATEVNSALESYAKSMDSANTALSTAYTNLLNAYTKNWNLIAAGELKLISQDRKDSKDLWTSIQNNYKKK